MTNVMDFFFPFFGQVNSRQQQKIMKKFHNSSMLDGVLFKTKL